MNPGHLAEMANSIGRFFEAEPDREEAVRSIQNHLQKFWDPRMRRQIQAYALDGGTELTEPVRAAVLRLVVPAPRKE